LLLRREDRYGEEKRGDYEYGALAVAAQGDDSAAAQGFGREQSMTSTSKVALLFDGESEP
jgi:hypothetical protein